MGVVKALQGLPGCVANSRPGYAAARCSASGNGALHETHARCKSYSGLMNFSVSVASPHGNYITCYQFDSSWTWHIDCVVHARTSNGHVMCSNQRLFWHVAPDKGVPTGHCFHKARAVRSPFLLFAMKFLRLLPSDTPRQWQRRICQH